jgi:agmatinase
VVESRIGAIADAGARPIVIGSDHSISLRSCALAQRHRPLALVQFDAHRHLGRVNSAASISTGRRSARDREGIIDGKRFIRSASADRYAARGLRFPPRHGITVIDIDQVKAQGVPWTIDQIRRRVVGAAYMTFDIDSVDPAFAPGTRTPGRRADEPRGAAARAWPRKPCARRQRHRRGRAAVRRSRADPALLAANLMFEFLCVLLGR